MTDNFQNLTGADFYPIRAQNIFDPQNFGVNMPTAPQQEPNMLDLIAKLYQPSNDLSDQFKQALSQMPQRQEPSGLRKVGAALAGMSTFGPAHFYGGVPVGFSGGNPEESSKIQDQFLNAPYYKKLEDWKLKTGMLEKGATEEQRQNVNKRITAETTAQRIIQDERAKIAQQQANIAAKREADYAKNIETKAQIAQDRANTYKDIAKGGTVQLDRDGNAWMVYKDGTKKDLDLSKFAPDEIQEMKTAGKLKEIAATGAQQRQTETTKETGRETLAQTKGWSVANIPDPKDPTKQIGVRVNLDTGEVKPITLGAGGQGVGPINKPGTGSQLNQLTTSTRTMMEGAQMLLPHTSDLRAQATALDKRGLFGPIMSRVRNLAAKVGTTGSPEEVEKSLNELSGAIASDPLINQSNDAAVGQFITNLGLMTSGMGRVHGGARGGASIQMVNYLKSLLTSDSTLSMFNGRLNSLESYLKGYAQGPIPAENTKLDQAINKILGVKK